MKLIKAILSILLPIFLIFRFWRPNHPLVELLVFFVSAFFILYLTTPRRQFAARGASRVECIADSPNNKPFLLKDHPGFREISRDQNNAVYQNKYGVIIYTEYRTITPSKGSGESPLLLLVLCLITACVGLVLFHLGEAAWSQFSLTGQLERLTARFTAMGEHLLRRAERLISDLYGAIADLTGKVKNLL